MDDLKRVELANELFRYTCYLFSLCVQRGELTTMENPRGSYVWLTDYVLELMRNHPLFSTDFQACMYGSMRDKWTRIAASVCERAHKHLGWGFTVNNERQRVWATSVESQYPRKLCIALVNFGTDSASGFKPRCYFATTKFT